MIRRSSTLVYSKRKHIPVGEALQLDTGELVLRVRHKDRRNKQKTEDILLTDLNKLVAAAAASRGTALGDKQTDPRPEKENNDS